MTEKDPDCPKCGEEVYRESADVGVGVIYGPWGCMMCGWSEDPRFDSSEGESKASKEHSDMLVFSDGTMMRKEGISENLERLGIKPPDFLRTKGK